MSLDISAKFRDRIFSADLIKEEISGYFASSPAVEEYGKSKVFFSSFCENDCISICFAEHDNRICKPTIINTEYEYRQTLIFDIDKFSDVPDNFDVVMKFIIYLQKKYSADIFVTSTVHDDVCYINEKSEIIWSDNYGYSKMFHVEHL